MLEVDVYCRWIDECERINQSAGHAMGHSGAPASKSGLGFTVEQKKSVKEETKNSIPG